MKFRERPEKDSPAVLFPDLMIGLVMVIFLVKTPCLLEELHKHGETGSKGGHYFSIRL